MSVAEVTEKQHFLKITCRKYSCTNGKSKYLLQLKISNIVATKDNANDPIYNLAGQQVSKNYKGVVIQNGVKRIQK